MDNELTEATATLLSDFERIQNMITFGLIIVIPFAIMCLLLRLAMSANWETKLAKVLGRALD